MRIAVVNGPNLNTLGKRDPKVYGNTTLAELEGRLVSIGAEMGIEVACFQSNHEGAIVDHINALRGEGFGGLVINPAGYTHTSVAIRDAIEAAALPAVEVHISNIHAREEFRQRSITAAVCVGQVAGLGVDGYEWALRALARRLTAK